VQRRQFFTLVLYILVARTTIAATNRHGCAELCW